MSNPTDVSTRPNDAQAGSDNPSKQQVNLLRLMDGSLPQANIPFNSNDMQAGPLDLSSPAAYSSDTVQGIIAAGMHQDLRNLTEDAAEVVAGDPNAMTMYSSDRQLASIDDQLLHALDNSSLPPTTVAGAGADQASSPATVAGAGADQASPPATVAGAGADQASPPATVAGAGADQASPPATVTGAGADPTSPPGTVTPNSLDKFVKQDLHNLRQDEREVLAGDPNAMAMYSVDRKLAGIDDTVMRTIDDPQSAGGGASSSRGGGGSGGDGGGGDGGGGAGGTTDPIIQSLQATDPQAAQVLTDAQPTMSQAGFSQFETQLQQNIQGGQYPDELSAANAAAATLQTSGNTADFNAVNGVIQNDVNPSNDASVSTYNPADDTQLQNLSNTGDTQLQQTLQTAWADVQGGQLSAYAYGQFEGTAIPFTSGAEGFTNDTNLEQGALAQIQPNISSADQSTLASIINGQNSTGSGDGGTTATPPTDGGGGTTATPPTDGGGGTTVTPPTDGGGGTTVTPPTDNGGGTTVTPPQPAPPPEATPPAAAAAAGYNTETFGPNINLGSGGNWQPYSQMGADPSTVQVTQNPDGTVTINGGGDTWGGQLQTNTAFGGGMYVQATISESGNPPVPTWDGGSDTEWPAFWADSIEGMKGETSTNQDSSTTPFVETDIMEADQDSNTAYASTIHHWPDNTNNSQPIDLPAGTNLNGSNTYGMLWVPATATSQGKVEWYLNGQEEGSPVTWNYGDTSSYGLLDSQHLQLYLGTDPGNPMTVSNVQVWQASNADDISTNS